MRVFYSNCALSSPMPRPFPHWRLWPRAVATVYVPYMPAANEIIQFATLALRAWIEPVEGEISTGDSAAESDFGRVQAVLGNSGRLAVQMRDLVYTPGGALDILVNRTGNLPLGLSVSTGQNGDNIVVAARQQLHVPIDFVVPGQTVPAAGRYAANITLSAFVPVPAPAGLRHDFKVIAAQTVGIDVVDSSHIDLQVDAIKSSQGSVDVHGQVQPHVAKVVVMLDSVNPDGTPATMLARTNGARSGTSITAVWAGNTTHAPASASSIVP